MDLSNGFLAPGTPVSRLTSALEGRYTIERELGAGGMATVYLAHDVKHDRKVAVKVLKPELAAVVGSERFLAEIRTTANLQHPHILPLFDSGEADGFLFFVMPYVEGESLRDRLDREKQLPVDEAVRIASEVADALQHAHGKGVIHRDIKPANILLRDGRVQVADFGIALAVQQAGGTRLTETGLSVGTPHYMSPEQASGDRELDGRSDVYSLGCVLYEMLAGEPPHTGPTAQSILSRILTDVPKPVRELRHATPAHVAAAVHEALEKLPADRFADASGFAAALSDPSFSGSAPARQDPRVEPTPGRTLLVTGSAALLGVLAGAMGWALLRGPGPVGPSSWDVALPDSAPMLTDYLTQMSVSPTGDFVVYVAVRDSMQELWLRDLMRNETRPIAGTEQARMPAISPTGDRVAFLTLDGFAKVVPIGGGPVVSLLEINLPTGIQWVDASTILVSDGDGTRAHEVDAAGGSSRAHDMAYRLFPNPLPNPTQYLCGGGGTQAAFVWESDSATRRFLRSPGSSDADSTGYLRGAQFRVVDDDYLTYMSVEGDLRATSFDAGTFQVGRSVTLIPGIRREAYTGAGQYDVGGDGTLVYAEGANGSRGEFVRVAAEGRIDLLGIETAYFLRFDLSPDGRRLGAVVEGLRDQELRIYNLDTGRWSVWLRGGMVGEPLWLDTDRLLVTVAGIEGESWAVLVGSPTATAAPDTVFAGKYSPPHFLTSHGDSLVIGNSWSPGAVTVLADLTASPPQLDTLIEVGVFSTLSPDARWIAYQPVDLSSLILTPFPARDNRFLIHSSGGILGEPQWRSESELVYWECCYDWYRVAIRPSPTDPVGRIDLWHSDPRFSDTPGQSFTLTEDGELVYLRGPERPPVRHLRVIPDWVTQMKHAVDEANW